MSCLLGYSIFLTVGYTEISWLLLKECLMHLNVRNLWYCRVLFSVVQNVGSPISYCKETTHARLGGMLHLAWMT